MDLKGSFGQVRTRNKVSAPQNRLISSPLPWRSVAGMRDGSPGAASRNLIVLPSLDPNSSAVTHSAHRDTLGIRLRTAL